MQRSPRMQNKPYKSASPSSSPSSLARRARSAKIRRGRPSMERTSCRRYRCWGSRAIMRSWRCIWPSTGRAWRLREKWSGSRRSRRRAKRMRRKIGRMRSDWCRIYSTEWLSRTMDDVGLISHRIAIITIATQWGNTQLAPNTNSRFPSKPGSLQPSPRNCPPSPQDSCIKPNQ